MLVGNEDREKMIQGEGRRSGVEGECKRNDRREEGVNDGRLEKMN